METRLESDIVLNAGINVGFMKNQVISNNYNSTYEIVHISEGDFIFREGEVPRGLYYVQSGCVKIFVNRTMARGRTTSPDYVTKLVSPGEYFGYRSLIQGGVHNCNARAVKSTTIWLYPKETVAGSLDVGHPLLKQLLQQSIADLDHHESTGQFHYLASVQERIAYQLILLANRFGVVTPEGISLNLKLTRNELAQMASTINESLSRHLTEFKTEGLIDLNGKEIIIKNRNGLLAKSGMANLK